MQSHWPALPASHGNVVKHLGHVTGRGEQVSGHRFMLGPVEKKKAGNATNILARFEGIR